MSAGGSYLNSNVSLISKALIRYEGTLFSINPQEATITLSNVRSYGTEDRKVEKYLAPKETLFEFIIFKANDIKELIIDEPLNDPAIVTAQAPGTTSSNAYSGFNENQQNNLQSNGLSSDAQATLNGISNNANLTTNVPSNSSAGQVGDRFRSSGSTPTSSHARSPDSELSSQNRQKSDLNKVISRGLHSKNNNQQNQKIARNGNNNNNNNNNNNQRRAWDNNRVNNFSNNNNRRQGNNTYGNNLNNKRYQGYQNNYPNNQFVNNRNGGFRRNDGRFPNHLNINRNNLPRNNFQSNNNHSLKNNRKFGSNNKRFDASLKTEFDFEKANEAFQQMVDKLEDLNISLNGEKDEKSGSEDKDKETTKNDAERVEKVDDDGNFYDKKKSFFDNISCEAIERTKGNQKRFDWKQERKLNAETFGLKITYRRRDNGLRKTTFLNNNRTNQNRRFNNGNQLPPRVNAPRTNSS